MEKLVIQCRHAKKSDVSILISFTNELVEENIDNKENGFIQHEFEMSNFKYTYVICENEEPVGMFDLKKFDESDFEFYNKYSDKTIPNSLYLGTFAINKNKNKHGFGKQLIKYLKSISAGYNIFCDIAIAPVENIASQTFFKKMGFVKESEFNYIHEDGIERTWGFYAFENSLLNDKEKTL